MMKLEIQKEIFERIPGLIVISGTEEVGEADTGKIAEYLKKSWDKLSGEVKVTGYKNHPLVLQWRNALKEAQIPINNFPPSIEAIAKRTEKVAEPFSISPIVDTYNAISMDLALPFGAYDINQLQGNLKLRISAGNESFMPMMGKEEEQTLNSEIVYADDTTVLTRQFLWRQSEKGKILSSTTKIIFVCELLESMGNETLTQAKDLIQTKFKQLLNADIQDLNIINKNK
jgi:DNA/RNA-binding domain of Phe-tRNA-synthetase-like protein